MKRLGGWVDEALTALSSGRGGPTSDSMPIDLLLGRGFRDDRALDDGLRLLRRTMALIAEHPHVACRLAVPLPESPVVVLDVPELQDLPRARDRWQPPKIYLQRASLDYVSGDYEEYRVGLHGSVLPWQGESYRDVEMSYTCFRDGEARRRGWDLQRTVWFSIRGETSAAL